MTSQIRGQMCLEVQSQSPKFLSHLHRSPRSGLLTVLHLRVLLMLHSLSKFLLRSGLPTVFHLQVHLLSYSPTFLQSVLPTVHHRRVLLMRNSLSHILPQNGLRTMFHLRVLMLHSLSRILPQKRSPTVLRLHYLALRPRQRKDGTHISAGCREHTHCQLNHLVPSTILHVMDQSLLQPPDMS